MIRFLHPAMLGGLLLIAIPVIIHLIHRHRFRVVEWGAMRFLSDMLLRLRRRLLFEELFLLLVRTIAVLCLALAIARPALRSSGKSDRDNFQRSGRTAAVLLIDDSLSSSAGRTHSAFEREKQLARVYLDTLQTGDEASIVLASRLGAPGEDPLVDLDTAKARIDALQPSTGASDYAALLTAGLDLLPRHLNPHAELVLISDGAGDGWRSPSAGSCDEIRRRLRGTADAPPGSHARPNVIVLQAEAGADSANLGMVAIRCDHPIVAVGRAVNISVDIAHRGAAIPAGSILRFSVNGRIAEERRLDAIDGDSLTLSFRHTFTQPGSHVIEAELSGTRDSLAADDRRALALEVENRLPVLLVESEGVEDLSGGLGYLAAALDPAGEGEALFAVRRIGVARLADADLDQVRVVVLGDLPVLDAADIAKLERFVASGGGMLAVAGPGLDTHLANRFWARGGDGFLPAEFGLLIESDRPLRPLSLSIAHPALAGFSRMAGQAWQLGSVSRYYRLDAPRGSRADIDRLIQLESGDPLLVERTRGLGRVIVCATTLDPRWNDFARHAAFAPLVQGIVGHLGSTVLPPRNLLAGDRLVFSREGSDRPTHLDGLAGSLPLESGHWEGRQAFVSAPLLQLGAYTVRSGGDVIRYAVNAAPEESLLGSDELAQQEALRDVPVASYSQPDQIIAAFAGAEQQGDEFWRPLVLIGLALLSVEIVVTWWVGRGGPDAGSKKPEAESGKRKAESEIREAAIEQVPS